MKISKEMKKEQYFMKVQEGKYLGVTLIMVQVNFFIV